MHASGLGLDRSSGLFYPRAPLGAARPPRRGPGMASRNAPLPRVIYLPFRFVILRYLE